MNNYCPYLIVRENSVPLCGFYGCPCECVKNCEEKGAEHNMHICHLYDSERQARIAAREYYVKEDRDDITRVIFNNSSLTIWTTDGNVHHFMGSDRYFQWSKGRTYMLSDGTTMRSGYPIK